MQELIQSLDQALDMESRLLKSPVASEKRARLQQWGRGDFTLVVMGEVKKGKSSFINALLRIENLLPVSSDVATSTIYRVVYAPERRYTVHFLPSSGKAPLTLESADVATYGTEKGNPRNQLDVDYIEVGCPSDFLASGTVIIDTPGLGGLYGRHRQITWDYVPKADAVFFVTDSVESPLGKLELDYLEEIRGITPHLYFVQTKCAAVDREAREARKENNLDILARSLSLPRDEIVYFLLDCTLMTLYLQDGDEEDLEASGYATLLDYIDQVLRRDKVNLLAQLSIQYCAPTLQNLRMDLQSQKDIYASDTEQKVRLSTQSLQERKEQLRHHSLRTYEQLSERVHELDSHMKQEMLRTLSQYLPQGEMYRDSRARIDSASSSEELEHIVAQQRDYLLSQVQREVDQFSQRYKQKMQRILDSIEKEASLPGAGEQPDMGCCSSMFERERSFSKTIRDRLYQDSEQAKDVFVALFQMLNTVLKTIPHPSAKKVALVTDDGTFARAIADVFEKLLKIFFSDRELKNAKVRVDGVLIDCFSMCHREMETAMDSYAHECSRIITREVKEYTRHTMSIYDEQIQALEERIKLDEQALVMMASRILEQERALCAIQETLDIWECRIQQARRAVR